MRFDLRRRAIIAAIPTGGLPSEYQEVEYIASTSAMTQWIDTDLYLDSDTDIYLDCAIVPKANSHYLFGSITSGAGDIYGLDSNSVSALAYCRFGTQMPTSRAGQFIGNEKAEVSVVNKTFSVIQRGSERLTIGNKSFPNENFVCQTTCGIFCRNTNGNIGLATEMKFYKFVAKKNGVTIASMIPCYRKIGGEIGVYDLIRRRFFANAGSGTFDKGGDV